jgi:hypothetical protein
MTSGEALVELSVTRAMRPSLKTGPPSVDCGFRAYIGSYLEVVGINCAASLRVAAFADLLLLERTVDTVEEGTEDFEVLEGVSTVTEEGVAGIFDVITLVPEGELVDPPEVNAVLMLEEEVKEEIVGIAILVKTEVVSSGN